MQFWKLSHSNKNSSFDQFLFFFCHLYSCLHNIFYKLRFEDSIWIGTVPQAENGIKTIFLFSTINMPHYLILTVSKFARLITTFILDTYLPFQGNVSDSINSVLPPQDATVIYITYNANQWMSVDLLQCCRRWKETFITAQMMRFSRYCDTYVPVSAMDLITFIHTIWMILK